MAAIQMRVINQPLPSHGGAWLLEVGTHHHQHISAVFPGRFRQLFRVFQTGLRVMDGAGSHDHQKTVVNAVQNGAHLVAGAPDLPGQLIIHGLFGDQRLGRGQCLEPADAQVGGFAQLSMYSWCPVCLEILGPLQRDSIFVSLPRKRQRAEKILCPVGSEGVGQRIRPRAPPEPTKNTHTNDLS